MAMNSYTVGTQLELVGNFINALTQAAADPTTVTMRVTQPDGSIVDLSSIIIRTGLGAYTAMFTPTQTGAHLYEWIGAGAVIATNVNSFLVNQTTF